jgi:hypothetical protein
MPRMSCVSGPRCRGLSVRAASLFCLALPVLVSPPVLTAHVELMSVRELAAASPGIVVATVEGRQSRWNELHTLILTDYTLRVEERLRGTAPDRLSITVPGGTLEGVSDDTCVSVRLQPGARYLLFLGDPDHSTFMPILGAEQGMFREVPGPRTTFAAGGASLVPLTFKGRPVTFRDFVEAVRSLAARIPLAPRSSPAAQAAPVLPAKTWSPDAPPAPIAGSLLPRAAPEAVMPPLPVEGAQETSRILEVTTAVSTRPRPPATGKFLYHELAPRPVVVNPLADSPFSPWDEYEMAYWNLYGGDLFRVSASPTPFWAYRNGVSDIAGFPDEATLKRQFGYGWSDLGEGVLAVTFTRREEGVLVEADVAFNPQKSWTIDDLAATGGQEKIFSFKEVMLHELGHVWGLNHPWDEEEWVSWDSVMNYKSRIYYVAELFADDTAAVRSAFSPGVPIRDGLISSYVTVRNEIFVIPNYQPALPSPATVRAGGGFGLTGPIKIENVGTVPLANPQVEVYLTPARLSFDGAVLLKRIKIRGKITSGGTQQVKLSGFKVPRKTPAGIYYLAYVLRDPKDAYQGNNTAWGQDGSTVTVKP